MLIKQIGKDTKNSLSAFSLPENKQKMEGAYTDGRNISL
jgi:hypothetical protein